MRVRVPRAGSGVQRQRCGGGPRLPPRPVARERRRHAARAAHRRHPPRHRTRADRDDEAGRVPRSTPGGERLSIPLRWSWRWRAGSSAARRWTCWRARKGSSTPIARADRSDNPFLLRLQALPNAIVTPHTAYYTERALSDTVEQTLINCLNFERNRTSGEAQDRDLVRGCSEEHDVSVKSADGDRGESSTPRSTSRSTSASRGAVPGRSASARGPNWEDRQLPPRRHLAGQGGQGLLAVEPGGSHDRPHRRGVPRAARQDG